MLVRDSDRCRYLLLLLLLPLEQRLGENLIGGSVGRDAPPTTCPINEEPINPACTEIILGILSSSSPSFLSGFLLFTRDLSTATDFRPWRGRIKVTKPLSGKAAEKARALGSQGSRKRSWRVERKRRSLERIIFKHRVCTRYEEEEEGKSKLDSEENLDRIFLVSNWCNFIFRVIYNGFN